MRNPQRTLSNWLQRRLIAILQIQQQAGVLDSEMVRAIQGIIAEGCGGNAESNGSALLMLGLGTGLAVLAGVVVDVVITLGRWRRKRQKLRTWQHRLLPEFMRSRRPSAPQC